MIKVDQSKVQQIVREQMPTLSPREFRKRLRDAFLFNAVEQYVLNSDNGYLKDAWEYSEFFSRTDPVLIEAMLALGLTDEKMDQIWIG